MRQLVRWLTLTFFTALVAAACSIDPTGTLTDSPDGGGAQDGGAGFGGVTGQCFVGAKVCDGKCVSESDPATGCGSGACDPCSAPNAAAKCTGDLCDLDTCNPGFDNCNGNTADGCETDLETNPLNCGACGNNCTLAGPTWIVCKAGQCKQSICPDGQADCDQDEVCEVDITSDVKNCGLCGIACSFPHAAASCEAKSCKMGACDTGYADCNNDPVDGCETNLQTDVDHCGQCTTKCQATNAATECKNGVCNPACAGGYDSCDSNPVNGCETQLNSVSNCGACGTKCTAAPPSGTPACQAGGCTFTCGGGTTKCGNACRNLTNDVNHCGDCGTKCTSAPSGGSAACQGSSCTFTCNSGNTKCGNSCINVQGSDVNNCGGCGTKCTAPSGGTSVCNSGSCDFTCGGGLTKCGSSCVDTQGNDVNNCGGCGTKCTAPSGGTAVCNNGSCNFTCGSLTKCGNSCVDLSSDPNNCSSCGSACNPQHVQAALCTSGSCDYTQCSTGYDDCDSKRDNGCEKTLGTDNDCGFCHDKCTGGKHCNNYVCN